MNEPSPTDADRLDQDRVLVLEWLRASPRNTPLDPASDREMIANCFLEHARAADFQWQVVEISTDGRPAYEVRWTHRGSTFVGFKQPAPADTPTDALLAGCAALLENGWCRARLPE
jgi:hypothetical protein